MLTDTARATTFVDEAEPLVPELEDADDRLGFRNANSIRNEEAAEIVHDFKNSLTAICMLSDLMLTGLPEKSPMREIARSVRLSCDDAQALCGRMLASFRDSSDVPEWTDLSHLVSRMAPLLAMWMSPASVLRFDLNPHLPTLKAAPPTIGQVVMNLVKNAAEAVAGRPGEVTVSTGWFELDTADLHDGNCCGPLQAGRHMCLAVSDTGCGIEEQARTRLLHGAFTSKTNGHGLGFASVRRIAAAHGAGILLDSEVGAGTTVRVLFHPDQNDPNSTH